MPTAAFLAALGGAAFLAFLMAHDSDGYLLGLDDLNLAFHEAGHLIFGILGSTIGLYGGTMGQLVFPVAVAVTFARRAEPLGVFGGAVWFFENLLNIARYMGDARARELPLLGGEHDWFAILGRWGLLESDRTLAALVRLAGWAGFVAAAVWLFRRWNTPDAQPGVPPV